MLPGPSRCVPCHRECGSSARFFRGWHSEWKGAEGEMGMVWAFQLWKNLKFLVLFNLYRVGRRNFIWQWCSQSIRWAPGPGPSQASPGSKCLIRVSLQLCSEVLFLFHLAAEGVWSVGGLKNYPISYSLQYLPPLNHVERPYFILFYFVLLYFIFFQASPHWAGQELSESSSADLQITAQPSWHLIFKTYTSFLHSEILLLHWLGNNLERIVQPMARPGFKPRSNWYYQLCCI